ncbi:hypothetical protein MML48_1g07529 [Holotrichia oblita]|uniref:Uncharacterized protein n=1 Tax=Holotrichia oblita TaxID=644536 RepID=A0ACB9TYZ6_HOLOL|nr:hypothetical protein MML48_1g07529 [Holotrichia oblita]
MLARIAILFKIQCITTAAGFCSISTVHVYEVNDDGSLLPISSDQGDLSLPTIIDCTDELIFSSEEPVKLLSSEETIALLNAGSENGIKDSKGNNQSTVDSVSESEEHLYCSTANNTVHQVKLGNDVPAEDKSRTTPNNFNQQEELQFSSLFTKQGNPRKRKKYDLSIQERKKIKRRRIMDSHPVRTPYGESCRLKCNEECEQCEHFYLHGHKEENLQMSCSLYQVWDNHIKKANSARTEYRMDVDECSMDRTMKYSVDMEKVIMLPRKMEDLPFSLKGFTWEEFQKEYENLPSDLESDASDLNIYSDDDDMDGCAGDVDMDGCAGDVDVMDGVLEVGYDDNYQTDEDSDYIPELDGQGGDDSEIVINVTHADEEHSDSNQNEFLHVTPSKTRLRKRRPEFWKNNVAKKLRTAVYEQLKTFKSNRIKDNQEVRANIDFTNKKLKEFEQILLQFRKLEADISIQKLDVNIVEQIKEYVAAIETIIEQVRKILDDRLNININMAEDFCLKTAGSLLPSMDGTEETTKQLIDSIRLYADLLKTDHMKYLINYVLKTRLSENAKVRLNSKYDSIDLLLKDLRDNFVTVKSASTLSYQLHQAHQLNKSLDEFGSEVEQLLSNLTLAQANGNDEALQTLRPVNEQIAISSFCNGLKNHELRTIVKARNCKTLKEAISTAKNEDRNKPSSSNIFHFNRHRNPHQNHGRYNSFNQSYAAQNNRSNNRNYRFHRSHHHNSGNFRNNNNQNSANTHRSHNINNSDSNRGNRARGTANNRRNNRGRSLGRGNTFYTEKAENSETENQFFRD